MDEIVFTREKLRRELLEAIDMLEKASASYDPEADVPVDDFAAAFTIAAGRSARADYANAVAHRVKSRAPARDRDA
jgi:hypothetical protein